MSEEFDFIGPNDLPALVAVTNPEALAAVKATLVEMGYKVHVVETHIQFETRYNQINYQVVVIEDTFAGQPAGGKPQPPVRAEPAHGPAPLRQLLPAGRRL